MSISVRVIKEGFFSSHASNEYTLSRAKVVKTEHSFVSLCHVACFFKE